jgi:D-threo-aldose 1-dehydrogenase
MKEQHMHEDSHLKNRLLFDRLVPPVAIGCAPLGDMPETFAYSVPEEIAHATVRAALESPLSWLDTAASYGDGESERRIGSVLRELGGLPEGAFLDTKIGAGPDGDFSADAMKRRFERSQQLLGMEQFELVFLHDPEKQDFEEITADGGPLSVLQDYREQGLIRHLGVAGGPIDLMMRYVETGTFDAAITHNRYTLLDRSAEPLIARCHELSIPLLNAAPYGSGILAKGPTQYPRYAYAEVSGRLLENAKEMEAVCSRYDIPLAAAALQFSLRDSRIVATIVGMSRPERIQQTIDLASTRIPDECWEELLAIPVEEGKA